MSFPAAEGPDTNTVVTKASQEALPASKWHSIKPDNVSAEFVDAPEKPLTETGKPSSGPKTNTSDKSKESRHTNVSSISTVDGPKKTASSKSKESEHTNVSFTSTVEYDQTPFEQYVHQVKELCHLLWPSSSKSSKDAKISRVERLLAKNRVSDILIPKRNRSAPASAPSKEFLIERLRGGGYNRIIGITIRDPAENKSTQLILRVPRFDDARPDREVAVLRFIRHYTTIPVPEVKYVDFTCDNPLKQRYVIQNRIPGYDLQHQTKPTCYPDLKHEQKCTVAKEFALILLKLHNILHPFPGLIEASTNSDENQDFTVRHFDLESVSGYVSELDLNTKLPFFQARPFVKDWVPSESSPFEQSTYYFMAAQLGRWKALELRSDPATICWSHDYDRLVTMATQMDDLGFLGKNDNCVCHLDLLGAPRNIMADINSDGSLSITGILDWDSAVFAPRFVGCVPPMWLWAWEEEEEDERHANDTPSTSEDREIKRIFEETVGERFLFYAYKPEYRLARELFRFAKFGIRTSTEIKEVEELLKEWNGIYESQMLGRANETANTDDASTEDTAEGEIDVATDTRAS